MKNTLKKALSTAIVSALGPEFADTDPLIQVVSPPHFGDYQANFALGLAKKLGKKPVEIAQQVLEHFHQPEICQQVVISGPGFINILLSDDFLQRNLQTIVNDERLGIIKVGSPQRVVVEYSSPNVAKEMHVGHLRSTVIGDAIARILDFLGHEVVRQNHVGDWGTQFGMLIQHILDTQWQVDRDHSISEITALYQQAKQRFDNDEDFARHARAQVVALQSGEPQANALWRRLVSESERHFQEVYARLGVLLTLEDVRGESFYNPMLAEIIEELESLGMVTTSEGAAVIFLPGFVDRDGLPVPMLVRKSDGGYLYSTTDLAALRFRIETVQATRLIYVVDARQTQHFAMLFAAAQKANWVSPQVRVEHVAFGSVLGKDRKPFKTRSGETVQLTVLLEEAESRAMTIIAEKNPQLSVEQRRKIAHAVGIGALKYADLSSDRIKDYIFDWDRMLAFDGNTAPYLQNAYVRIFSIFRKGSIAPAALYDKKISITEPIEHVLAIQLLEFPNLLQIVAEDLAMHRLCQYLFDLAATYHKFYENCPVLNVTEPTVRDSRLLLCDLTARTLRLGLGLLGIETVEQM